MDIIQEALKIPGFTSEEFLKELWQLAHGKVNIIEIGAFQGRSTVVLAQAVIGLVYSIDIWDTRMYDPSVLPQGRMDWDECLAYRQFLSNMRRLGVAEKVIPMIGNSHWLERYFKPDTIDVVFVDGDHAEHMVRRDIELYLPKLRPTHGIMCGDDYDMPSVQRPVDAMAMMSGWTVETFAEGKGWIFKK